MSPPAIHPQVRLYGKGFASDETGDGPSSLLPRFPDVDTAKEGADVLYNMWKNAQKGALPKTLKVIVLSDAKSIIDADGSLKAYINVTSLMFDAPTDSVQKSWIDACSTIKTLKFMVGGEGYGCAGQYIIIDGR
eukprot:CAMPEP_0182495684 /NCGR_PEP_ID=MMETSP1321-20130603/4444_1 /TAXON_ID=91990 /ORGANISM="Bolidomonas sp., Strain RCC1657" /LENGTH=133 /DNA_ID=CAMNT_0024699125 /DNA_START=29 /DNA_END=426 /DNA_ORIENTATION=+